MTTLTVNSVASGKTIDTIIVGGGKVAYDTGAARNMVESRAHARGISDADAALELDGWSNGYLAFKPDDSVTAAGAGSVRSAFVRHPAPPPHEQWMHGGKKAAKKPSKLSAGASTDADIQAMSDDQLFDMFAELSQHDTIDEPLMRRLVADMDRRERATSIPALHDDAMTPEQRRVDALVASGRDFLSAYAEVHGADERRLAEEARASGVDRKPGEGVRAAVRSSYDEWLHVAYLKAEKATKGNMLNRAGKKAGVDPLELFTGPVSRARRYASEELMRWWVRNERLNFTQFRAQVLGQAGDVAAAEKTRLLSNGKDFI